MRERQTNDQPDLIKVESIYEKHWKEMPEFKMEDKTSHRKLIVHFRSDEDFHKFCETISQKVGMKQPSIWFPEMPYRKTSHLTYK